LFLIDTNVLSEALRPAPEPKAIDWLDGNFSDSAISSVTIFELNAGVAMMAAGRRRDALGRSRREDPRPGESRRLGLHQAKAKLAELQIAGITSAYGLVLATRNVAVFQGLGLELADPWA
jgi:predicted nucleic acid-binding protein